MTSILCLDGSSNELQLEQRQVCGNITDSDQAAQMCSLTRAIPVHTNSPWTMSFFAAKVEVYDQSPRNHRLIIVLDVCGCNKVPFLMYRNKNQ